MVGAVGIELLGALKTRNLLIPRNSKGRKTTKTLNRGTCGVHGRIVFLASLRGRSHKES